jgi:glycosyltransferase involved in cell wall biosynthesis
MPTNLDFKIHALVCTYNDYPTLPLALDSVRDVVDSIIIADGAYKKYYDNFLKFDETVKPWSTDGTLGIIKSLEPILPPVKLIGCPDGKPWQNQTVKRTAMLDAVPDRDWFVILDSDEMFFGNLKNALYEVMGSGCIAGCMPLFQPGLDENGVYMFWHPRIYLKLPGMYYERKHWLLCDFADRVIEATHPLWMTNQCVLAHFKIFRNMRRLAPHMSYMLDMSKSGWQEPGSKIFKREDEDEGEVIME